MLGVVSFHGSTVPETSSYVSSLNTLRAACQDCPVGPAYCDATMLTPSNSLCQHAKAGPANNVQHHCTYNGMSQSPSYDKTVLPQQHGRKKSRQRGLLAQLRMPATDFSHYPTGWFLGLRRQRWLSTCSVRGTTSPSLHTTCMGLGCCSSAPVADNFQRGIWMPSAMGPRRDTPASCAVHATQHHTRAR